MVIYVVFLLGRLYDHRNRAGIRVLGVLLVLRAHAGGGLFPRAGGTPLGILGLHVEELVGILLHSGIERFGHGKPAPGHVIQKVARGWRVGRDEIPAPHVKRNSCLKKCEKGR